MGDPRTTLDTRFSDPEAAPTPWDETRRALQDAELFWISTVRRDGRPHITPLVAVWLDEALHFCTGPDEQKALNIAHDPHVILMTGCNRWDEGLDVVVEGQASRVLDEAELERLAQAWATKWDGRWQYVARDGLFWHSYPVASAALVFAVTPEKIFAFRKGAFSQTRHQF